MPKLKRSITATGLTLALAVGLAACGANNDDAAPADTAPSASASPSVSQAADTTDADAQASPSQTSTSPSTSPSPSGPYEPATSKHPAQNVPEPGPLPEVAKEKSKAGQVAFIEHWFKEINYGFETGELRPDFRELNGPECSFCRAVEDHLASAAEDKAWSTGGKLTFRNIRPTLKPLEKDRYLIELDVLEEERHYYKKGHSEPVATNQQVDQPDAAVLLIRKNGHWLVGGYYADKN